MHLYTPFCPRPPSASQTHRPRGDIGFNFSLKFKTSLANGDVLSAITFFKAYHKRFSKETIFDAFQTSIQLKIDEESGCTYMLYDELAFMILDEMGTLFQSQTPLLMNMLQNAILSDEISFPCLGLISKIISIYPYLVSGQNDLLQCIFAKALNTLALFPDHYHKIEIFTASKQLALDIIKKHPKFIDSFSISEQDESTVTKAFLNLLSHPNKYSDDLEYFLLDYYLFQASPQIIRSAFEKSIQYKKKYITLKMMEMYSNEIDPKYIKTLFQKAINAPILKRKMIIQIMNNYTANVIGHDLINELFKKITFSTFVEDSGLIEATIMNPDFANQIDSDLLVKTYLNTFSEDVAIAIYFYIKSTGSWRQLQLPRNQNGIQLESDFRMDHAAQEIHKYSAGLDKICLFQLKKILSRHDIRRKYFSIEDLKQKIENLLLDPEDRQKSLSALDKLLSDPQENIFSEKFKNTLPVIADFLNSDLISWKEKSSAQERWTLWLKQSFLESAQAYDGDDSTSCQPGIYERVFSGLRTLHHVVDAIFFPSNLMQYYFPLEEGEFDPKVELLIRHDVLETVVKRLLAFYRTQRHRSSNIDTAWNHFKCTCEDILISHIELNFRKQLLRDYSDLISDDLMQEINEIIETKIPEIKMKIKLFIDNLESIDLAHATDAYHPILFHDLVSKIYCHIEKRKNPRTLHDAVDIEIASTLHSIKENKLNKKIFDLIQKDFHTRMEIENEERSNRYDIIDYKDQILSEE